MWQRIVMMGLAWIMLAVIPLTAKQQYPLRLLFAGDIMAHDVNITQRDHHRIYERIKPFYRIIISILLTLRVS